MAPIHLLVYLARSTVRLLAFLLTSAYSYTPVRRRLCSMRARDHTRLSSTVHDAAPGRGEYLAADATMAPPPLVHPRFRPGLSRL
ncbi:hypothetical protein C2E23DRAFT_810090 [Lenzites betulinus]|nr:hypothetical protein C2E23DRAFT_810090 [Lenzites betulinus]